MGDGVSRTVRLHGEAPRAAKPFVVAIMALWDEALTLPLALDSSRRFVDEYFVVHKLGTDNTADVLQACIDKWGLHVKYLQSNMTLREARLHAMSATRNYADVFLLQDGDEVMYTEGPTAVGESLRLLFGAGYDVISSKMVYLKHNLVSTFKDGYVPGGPGKWGGHPANGIMLIPHPTIFRNLPEYIMMPESLTEDVPQLPGRRQLITHEPWKFDVSIKHPLREYLRAFFYEWSAAGSPGTIEEWAMSHDPRVSADSAKNPDWTLLDSAQKHVDQLATESLMPYKESEWHPYPESIRIYINAMRLRGYEGGEILSTIT